MNTKSLFAASVAAMLVFAAQSPANAAMGGLTNAPIVPSAVVHKTAGKKQKFVAGLLIGAAVAAAIAGGRDGHRARSRDDYDDGPRYRRRGYDEGRRYRGRRNIVVYEFSSGDRRSRRGSRHRRANRFAGE